MTSQALQSSLTGYSGMPSLARGSDGGHGIYHEALAEYFHGQGYRIAVLNPAQIARYAQSQLQRSKTDKLGAKLIATYGQLHVEHLCAWQPEPASVRQLRALTRRLEDLQSLRQMVFNRLDVSLSTVQYSI